mmetsp:Transcript_41852/g.64036  ORF Transcript_41852/g.64036 Transcript_41852/m.64036 type:complete len:86 (-) Transcript_41852:328-585(-)
MNITNMTSGLGPTSVIPGESDLMGMGSKDMMMMEMDMYFYQSPKVHFIFEKWTTESWGTYSLSLIGTFLVCFLIEMLNYQRHKIT